MSTATADRLAWTTGDRLAKARNVAGLTMSQMAAELGVSRYTVSNYENDHTKPSRAVLRVWAEVTAVDLEWLAPEPGSIERYRSDEDAEMSPRVLIGAAA